MNHSSLAVVKGLGERGAGRAVRRAWWWEAPVKAEELNKLRECGEPSSLHPAEQRHPVGGPGSP